MCKIIPVLLSIFILLTLAGGACNQSTVSQSESQQIAENFMKNDTTYLFDSIPVTLKLTNTETLDKGWKFTFEFDSRQAGYGDRSGQTLAQVIMHHAAEITVKSGKVTLAIMDGVWDMVNQQMLENFEIDLAPIHEVNVTLLLSNPPQIGVYIKGGLRDGCTKFHNIETTQEGDVVNIKVTTRHPKDVFCPAIYTYFEKNVILGSKFTMGTTYTLNVNDYATTFTY